MNHIPDEDETAFALGCIVAFVILAFAAVFLWAIIRLVLHFT